MFNRRLTTDNQLFVQETASKRKRYLDGIKMKNRNQICPFQVSYSYYSHIISHILHFEQCVVFSCIC